MNSKLALAAATFTLAVTTGLIGGTTPSRAWGSGNLQWCAQNVTYNPTGDCSYASFEQCQATISGIGGDCIQNPRLAYDPSYGDPRERRVQSRRWRNGGY